MTDRDKGVEDDNMMELIYDPILDIYYDPI